MWPVDNFGQVPRKEHLGVFNITQVASSMLRQKGTESILAKRQELMSHLRTRSDTAQGLGMWPRK